VIVTRLEDATLPDGVFDSVVAATSMHWVDLHVGLPILHRVLRPGGWLAVWRTVFGDDTVSTPSGRTWTGSRLLVTITAVRWSLETIDPPWRNLPAEAGSPVSKR
jgi:SAM-dependent methyltransferase